MTQETPAGLIVVQDLINAHPRERERLIVYEIRRRERELLLYRGAQRLIQWHLWSAVKVIAGVGLSVFLFVWTLGEFAALAQWFKHAQSTIVTIPLIIENIKFDPHSIVPTSTLIEYAAQFPAWDWRDAGMVAIAAMIIVLAEKIVMAYFGWRQSIKLKEAKLEIEGEIEVLKSWQSIK